MAMNDGTRQELMQYLREVLARPKVTKEYVADMIWDAHNGRPDGYIVTNDNLHLFRQYRNSVSSDPTVMIEEALAT